MTPKEKSEYLINKFGRENAISFTDEMIEEFDMLNTVSMDDISNERRVFWIIVQKENLRN